MHITAKNHEQFTFRRLETHDADLLGDFFEDLSQETRSKFGPHPLTREYARERLCATEERDNVVRYLIASDDKVVGYFIVDFRHSPHEHARYQTYQMDLDSTRDPVFAPCIADHYQSLGVASQAMAALIEGLTNEGIRSLVLMGGTQLPNHVARRFYRKFGFKEQGEFHTHHNGLDNVDMRLIL